MRIATLAPLALALATPISLSAAAPPQILEPYGAWNAHYADESCKLARAFGQGKNNVLIFFEAYSPQDLASLMVVGRRFRADELRPNVSVIIGTLEPIEREAMAGSIGDDQKPMLLISGIPLTMSRSAVVFAQPDQQREHAIDRPTVKVGRGSGVVLHTGPMDRPLAALRTCLDALVKSWGLDPAQQRMLTGVPTPKSSPGNWIRDNDYPMAAINAGASGIVHFRLMVDETGQPTSCVIQSRTKPDDFAPLACKLLMKRARFTPAQDSVGKPVPSYFTSSVRFLISR